MRRLFLSIFLFFFFVCSNTVAEIFLSEDLAKSLSNLYSFNHQIKYEREILKSKDELLPKAFSEFRPEIRGYYQKGKIDTNSEGFNISSDGIRTETNKGVIVSQSIFDGGSSLSQIKEAL